MQALVLMKMNYIAVIFLVTFVDIPENGTFFVEPTVGYYFSTLQGDPTWI
jgi:hypothetical protein